MAFLPRLRLLTALALLGTSLSAHDTWLLPTAFQAPEIGPIVLDLTSGMAFPKNETPIKPERVESAWVRSGPYSAKMPDGRPTVDSLRLDAQFGAGGFATIAVSLRPRTLELTRKNVAHYLAEISASAEVRERARRLPRWRESYVKHAKSFVRIREDAPDESWREPMGQALEIVPGCDPRTLRAGGEFPVTVLKQGKPLANFPLNRLFAGEKKGETKLTDAEGKATFRLIRTGACLLRGTELRASTQAGLEWESDFATLTVEVRPAAAKLPTSR